MSDRKGNERQVPNLTTFKVLPKAPVGGKAVESLTPTSATKPAPPPRAPAKPVPNPSLQLAEHQKPPTPKALKMENASKKGAAPQVQEKSMKAELKPETSKMAANKPVVTARRKAGAKRSMMEHSKRVGTERIASKNAPKKPVQSARSVKKKAGNMNVDKNTAAKKTKAVPTPQAVSGKESPNFFGTKMFGIDLGRAVSKEIDGMVKFANDNCADAVQASTVLSKGFEDVSKHMADYVKRRVESGIDLSRILVHATTLKDIISVHSDLSKCAIEDFLNENKKIADISFKASMASIQPVKIRAEKNLEVFYGSPTR